MFPVCLNFYLYYFSLVDITSSKTSERRMTRQAEPKTRFSRFEFHPNPVIEYNGETLEYNKDHDLHIKVYNSVVPRQAVLPKISLSTYYNKTLQALTKKR